MIYNEGKTIPIPNVDFCTYIFDSEYGIATDDTPLSAEAKYPHKILTKADNLALIKHFAYFLRHEYGIGESGPSKDIVVTASTGQSALPALFFSVLASEGIYSAASTSATVPELVRQVRDGPAKVIICSKDRRDLVLGAAREAGVPGRNVLILESYPEVKLYSADGSVQCDFKGSLAWRRITNAGELKKSVICILYSSGTTGLPKGVLISHLNIVAATHIPSMAAREDWIKMGISSSGCTIAHLPAAHIAGIMAFICRPFCEGRLVYWMPSYNLEDLLKYCRELKVTSFFTVPPIYMAIAKHPGVTDEFKNVLSASTGAAPMSSELQAAASEKLPVTIGQTYGMSEMTGGVSYSPAGRTDLVGSLGVLADNITMRLVDDDDKDVEPGQPGEALFKGSLVTQGYYKNPEATRAAFTPDGWLRSGDIIKMVGDALYIVDRKKELIKYKGHQVAPAELEGLLSDHPAISDAAVIGVKVEENEVPRAFVVLAPSAKGKMSEADVIDYVASKVSNHKRLRGGVKFIEMIPRNPSGKILRKELRALQSREAKL